jgi:hypothetical protein
MRRIVSFDEIWHIVCKVLERGGGSPSRCGCSKVNSVAGGPFSLFKAFVSIFMCMQEACFRISSRG